MAVCLENSLQFFVPVFASLFNGSIVAPLNPLYTAFELEHVLNISKPKVVFCSDPTKFSMLEFIERIIVPNECSTCHRKPVVQTISEFVGSENADANTFRLAEGDPSKMIAAILCSSGTSGFPKGVAQTHEAFNVALAYFGDARYFSQQRQNVLALTPFFHTYGFAFNSCYLARGGLLTCFQRFEEDLMLESIEKYQINWLIIAPALAIFLGRSPKVLDHNMSSVSEIFCGSAPLSQSVQDAVEKRFPNASFRQGYGLTETTFAVSIIDRNEARPGSCGKIMIFANGKITNSMTGRTLGPYQLGEICLRGPIIMRGYYENEPATRAAFTTDGYLKTGDLGYYDNDGYLYVVDRLKELIKYKGFQISPAELEGVLLRHPGIVEAGVIGMLDELTGEKPVAFIMKNPGTHITEQEVMKHVANLVSPHKLPRGGIIFLESLPKGPTGKVSKKELRKLLQKYRKQTNVNSKL